MVHSEFTLTLWPSKWSFWKVLFTRISFIYLLTCCQGGLKTCFIFLSSLSISSDLLFQFRLYKSANYNTGWVKAGEFCRLACWYPRESNCSDKSYLHFKFYQGRMKFNQVIRFFLLLAGLLDGRYSVGRFGWLAGSYHLDSFPYCSPYLLNFHFKFYQNRMKIADFIAVRLVIIIAFSQKSVETLKPCKIQWRLVFS